MLDGLSKYTVADSPLVVLRVSVTCELSIRCLPRSLHEIQPRGCAFRGGGEGGEGRAFASLDGFGYDEMMPCNVYYYRTKLILKYSIVE